MSGADLTRLRKEMIDCGKDFEKSGVWAAPVGDELTHLRGRIRGPIDTAYEGGLFEVDIVIPRGYPFEPPKMKFMTSIWHPNVSSQTGAICLDILKTQWSPALTIKTALLSLQALLSAPEPDDPQDAQVASQYKKDYKGWVKTAKHWTDTYAKGSDGAAKDGSRGAGGGGSSSSSSSSSSGDSSVGTLSPSSSSPAAPSPAKPSGPPADPRLQMLIDMGFDKARALSALQLKNGNVEAAVEYLFANPK
jgi:ubiquitin-conjugating enzyme (huntingtin interacting protein 2)